MLMDYFALSWNSIDLFSQYHKKKYGEPNFVQALSLEYYNDSK